MLLRKSHKTCYRALSQLNDTDHIDIQGESGVLGLLAYNVADVLSAMKLSFYMLEHHIDSNSGKTDAYKHAFHKHMDNLELLVDIMRQLGMSEGQIQRDMQVLSLSSWLRHLQVRLSSSENWMSHVVIPESDADLYLNPPMFHSALMALLRYCVEQKTDAHLPLNISAEYHDDEMHLIIHADDLYVEPQAFYRVMTCFCEGPQSHCTLKQSRSFKQNLDELILSNAQHIVMLHGGRVTVHLVAPQQSQLVIVLPKLT